jgi:hypothetical protein
VSVTAKLKVILKANDVEVAESEDPTLWQKVFAALTSGSGDSLTTQPTVLAKTLTGIDSSDRDDPIGRFAVMIGVETAQVVGACNPSKATPFLELNAHCWEAMKRALPQRGPGSLAAIQLSATLLGLWFQCAGLGTPNSGQAQGVLGTINQRDNNAARGMGTAEWLQKRAGGAFNINPAQMSRAIAIAKSFVTSDWSIYLSDRD